MPRGQKKTNFKVLKLCVIRDLTLTIKIASWPASCRMYSSGEVVGTMPMLPAPLLLGTEDRSFLAGHSITDACYICNDRHDAAVLLPVL
jgi:hypothetical protein